MAEAKTVIRDLLINDPTVSGLVGSKVFAVVIPQNAAFPAISLETISTQPLETKGFLNLADLVALQINIFATNDEAAGINGYDKAVSISTACRAVLDFKNGFTNNGLKIAQIRFVGAEDGQYNNDLNLYHRILRYDIDIDQNYVL